MEAKAQVLGMSNINFHILRHNYNGIHRFSKKLCAPIDETVSLIIARKIILAVLMINISHV